MEGAGENVGILVYAAVHDRRLGGPGHFKVLLRPVAQEKDLQMEGPFAHVCVEVGEVGIVRNRFKGGLPSKADTQALG